MSQPVVSLTGITKTFDNGFQAVGNVSLTVHPGDFISVLGPSGCGKSTVLKLLAGLMPVSSGQIRWDPATLRRENPARPDLAFVFQEATLMPWRTVEANVAMPLVLQRLPRREIQARVREVLSLVHLSGFEKVYPRQLSGGMKMRVSIARALVTRPKILLMDEPFAALDEMTRQKLNDDLAALWRHEKLTILFVTHNVYEAAFLSSRVLVMTPRPGDIHSDIALDADAPRDEDFRISEVYIRDCERISRHMRMALRSGPEARKQ